MKKNKLYTQHSFHILFHLLLLSSIRISGQEEEVIEDVVGTSVEEVPEELQAPALQAADALTDSENLFKAYDCSKPVNIQGVMQTPESHCPETVSAIATTEKRKYQLIQREKYQRFYGWKCKVTMSRIAAFCGAYDHMTLDTTSVMLNQPILVRPEKCKSNVEK